MRKLLLSLAIVSAFALLCVSPAWASPTSVVYDFTSCHATGGCGTAPYGSVTLTQNGNNVDVTVSLNNGNYFVSTGAGDNYYFKFVGLASSTSTYSGPSLTFSNVGSGSTVNGPGSYDGDGTGYFAFGVTCSSCSPGNNPYTSDITFTVDNATISDLTVANGLGNVFVADAYLSSTGKTGPIDAESPVPEPASLLLLGSGLLGLGGIRLRRHKGALKE